MKKLFASTKFIGKVTHRFSQLTSTNSHAREIIANGEPVHGTVIVADFQTQGRGQKGNIWHAAAGKNLMFSIILKPNKPIESQFYLNKAITIAMQGSVAHFINSKPTIKWPNDILIDQLKISGLLIENFIQQNALQYSIIGIGLNVNQLIFPNEVNATSLCLETGMDYDVMEVAENIAKNIETQYDLFENNKFEKIDQQYHQVLFKNNEQTVFTIEGKKVVGKIKQVNKLGQLVVEINGETRLFRNQEIAFEL